MLVGHRSSAGRWATDGRSPPACAARRWADSDEQEERGRRRRRPGTSRAEAAVGPSVGEGGRAQSMRSLSIARRRRSATEHSAQRHSIQRRRWSATRSRNQPAWTRHSGDGAGDVIHGTEMFIAPNAAAHSTLTLICDFNHHLLRHNITDSTYKHTNR